MTDKSRTKTRPFDAAEFLDDEETIQAYIDEALETGDPSCIAHAMSVVARAREMIVADRAGAGRVTVRQ